jgi:hypothetical protein
MVFGPAAAVAELADALDSGVSSRCSTFFLLSRPEFTGFFLRFPMIS